MMNITSHKSAQAATETWEGHNQDLWYAPHATDDQGFLNSGEEEDLLFED